VVVGDFNTPLSPIDRLSKQKINKEILELNDTTDLMEPTDVYRVFHPATAQHTFSASHGTYSKIYHILEHEASLNKYKKTETMPCILSDHNVMKLELNQRSSRIYTNNWRLNNTLINDQRVIAEIKEKIKKFLDFDENENTIY
jgi:endonuclease/exonuclease/phosphatase family metal-dependent hydrolase